MGWVGYIEQLRASRILNEKKCTAIRVVVKEIGDLTFADSDAVDVGVFVDGSLVDLESMDQDCWQDFVIISTGQQLFVNDTIL